MSATAHVYSDSGPGSGRGRGFKRSRWRPLEVAAIVLGFIIWWVLGLALLLWKLWRTRQGRPADIIEAARTMEEKVMRTWPEKARRWGCSSKRDTAQRNWSHSRSAHATGNSAFDEWRDAELSRLDEERRKLEDAAREFSEYVENLRKAKDREEFDQFMRDHRNKPAGDTASSGPQPQA